MSVKGRRIITERQTKLSNIEQIYIAYMNSSAMGDSHDDGTCNARHIDLSTSICVARTSSKLPS